MLCAAVSRKMGVNAKRKKKKRKRKREKVKETKVMFSVESQKSIVAELLL